MHITEDRDFQLVKEHFERIAKSLEIFWGSSMFCEYIDMLLNDTRDGKRQGFPKPVFEALLRLNLSHRNLFPQFNKPIEDPALDLFKYYN